MLRRALRLVASLGLGLGVLWVMMPFLLNSLLYFPSRHFFLEPGALDLHPTDVVFETEDGERLHAWWFRAGEGALGHVLLFHGNAGNIGDRLLHTRLLTDAGLDVFCFDYRGYGRSTGRPDEEGTYRDARAARRALLRQEGAEEDRVFYVGESLGGAVALALAVEDPPRGLVLLSTFTSVRDMGRVHYPVIPTPLVPDAYPSLDRIRDLRCPLLVMHGDRDNIVPVEQGQALFEAAPEPKWLHLFPGAGHNDLLDRAGREWADTIADWVRDVVTPSDPG
jgi:pimeloyl-ACP methyl ester carboxylesterase